MFDQILILVKELFSKTEQLSGKHFLLILLLFLLGIMALSIYERYTSNFQYTKLEKSVELYQRLYESDSTATNHEKMKDVHEEIIKNLKSVVKKESRSLSNKYWLLKFVISYIPWCFIGLGVLVSGAEKKKRDENFTGVLALGAFMALFTSLLPAFWWPWGHLVILQLLIIIVALTIIIAWVAIKR